ncbi:hypothetical protein ASE59_15460 [Sphingomonas sp. Leaf10]|nr:hypothetical protein ASE59_15460 [Sphingomonas sp. Leaf10]
MVDNGIRLLTGYDPKFRCFEIESVGGTRINQFVGPRRCYDFLPPRSYDGIYVDEFEGRRFVPIDWPSGRNYTAPSIWFDVDEASNLRAARAFASNFGKRDGQYRLWRVRFVGRETVRPGRYGHMGMSKRLLLVDRMVKADLLLTHYDYLPDGFDPRTINSDNRR